MPLPQISDISDVSLGKMAASFAGALVSLRFLKNCSAVEKFLMVLGGSVLSYHSTPVAAAWTGLSDVEGLVGFMVGLFGMAIVAKVYEVIQALDPAEIARRALDRFGK